MTEGEFSGSALWFDVLSPIGFSFSDFSNKMPVVGAIHESIVCRILISDRIFRLRRDKPWLPPGGSCRRGD